MPRMIVIPRYVCPVMSDHAKVPVPRAESVKRSLEALIVERQHEEEDAVQFRQNTRKYTILQHPVAPCTSRSECMYNVCRLHAISFNIHSFYSLYCYDAEKAYYSHYTK
jgi:hypothetical protein